ncbi:zinc finger protein 804A-like [Oncorhynchus masou masou]|uniref:zinc finger protein 804A-like n=1 Tax=Oncorhynchus masou masou TaxID=90313 RepID=UPI003183BE4A
MACYYIVISSTHLSNGHFRNIKGVFRGPLSKNGNKNLDYAEKERTTTMAKALEDLKANFYCDLCDKQYYKHQEFDNHINSYDHAHKQRLKELKQREFARNVASKTRKDERKQERALQRLHELAEQRREVQCAPGSGPKFKSTTIAVDASCRESCTDGLLGESHNSTALETGTHNHTTGTSTGLASNSKTQQTLYWPHNGKAKKQTYKRHKIAFSFSFPKKALVKLDSAAAVFCENAEEGSKERTGTQKLRIPLVELNVPVSTTAEEKGLGFAGVEINGTKPGDLSLNGVSKGSQKSSDTLSRSDIPMPPQASHLYSVLVNSEDIVRHDVSSVSQLAESLCHIPLDDPDTVLDTQNSEETQRNVSTEAEPDTSKQQQVHRAVRSVSGVENISISSSDGPSENVSSSSQSSERPGTAREKGEDITVVVKTLSGPFTKPSQPFFSVLSKDEYTVLQWPSEMLTFTRTEPRLSYSCNPLHFDFKTSQQLQSRAKVRTGDSQSKTELRISEALCIGSTSVCSEELIDNKHNKEAYSRPDHHIPIRDDRETVERKDCLICDHHMSDIDTEICNLQLKRHSRVYSSGKSGSQSKDQTGKRAAGIKKWKSRDRRHYRSHKKKKRRRRRRRGGYEEERHRETETDGGVESDAEKCNKFQRQSECWEGLDSQFRGPTSQPLEKSKQSAQNQADSGHAAPSATEDRERERVKREREREEREREEREREEREKEGSRQETAGSVNGSAGSLSLCDEGATDSEKVFGSDGRRGPVDPSTEQRNAAGHSSQSSQSHDKPCTENPAGAVRQKRTMVMTHLSPQSPGTITQKPSMTKSLSPESCGKDCCCIGQSLRRKRTASSLLDADEQGFDHQVPCTKCQSPVMVEPNGPDGSMVEGGSSWSVCVSCGGAGRQRKRQRGSSYTPHISDLPVGHNVHISDPPVGHNVRISDPPEGHNVLISDPPVGHNVRISDPPVGHNVHISDLPVGHNVQISDLPVGHNVHMVEPPVDVKSDDRCKMNLQNLMNTDVEYPVVKGPLASCSAPSQPAVEHSSKPMGGSPRLQIQNNVPSIKEDSSSSPSLPRPVQDPPNPPEIISITNENKNITICLQNSPNVSLPIMVHNLEMGNNGEDCITRQTVTVAAHVNPLGAREITPPFITPQRFQIQNMGPDKSCQHSFQSYPNQQRCHSPQPPQGHTQHQRCYPGIRVNDEMGIREGLRPGGLNITGSLCSPYHRPASPYHNHRPPSFHPQHPSDGMEKHHCVVQIQTHRHILHHHQQHQVFPGKMKPVLPGSPVPMSPSCPPMLHPVHLSPVPNGSITIQHTILHHQHHHAYHHGAFLPPHPQPPLFPQVLPVPVSRRPMGADMCPPGPSPFLTSSPHLSVVAPPSLHHHPMAVTFHAMPRPTMFPPSMLQSHPHPTIIPLQPMF